MSDDGLLSEAQIRSYLIELAAELPPDGGQHTILVVGGARLAWIGLRDATRDVDSVLVLDQQLQAAAQAVAHRHGLAPGWLNHHSSAFLPQTLREADCDVLVNLPGLLVLGAPLLQVFVMKMHAARDRDFDDLVALWPLLEVDPEEVVAKYWEAYPSAPEDPHLLSWVVGIRDRAS